MKPRQLRAVGAKGKNMEWSVNPEKATVTVQIPSGTYTKEFDRNTKLVDAVLAVAQEYNLSNVIVRDSNGNEIDDSEENRNKTLGELGAITIAAKTVGAGFR